SHGHRPQRRGHEAVGIGHVVEVERIGAGDTGNDAGSLDPEQDQGSPQHVEKLDRDEQQPQREGRIPPLGGEANSVVPDEHENSYLSMSCLAGPFMPIQPRPTASTSGPLVPMSRSVTVMSFPVAATLDPGPRTRNHTQCRPIWYRRLAIKPLFYAAQCS